jgi:hypothetical protein
MTTLRVAYVGNFGPPYSTENDVASALELLGHEVIPLQENATTAAEIERQALVSDLLLWTSTWDDAIPRETVVDLAWRCEERGIPTAAYHLDVFHGTVRGGRRWEVNPMWVMAHVFTADGDHEAEWEAYEINHHWLPAGVRESACYFGEPLIDYRCDVAFVGASGVDGSYHPEVWPYRAELVAKLAEICKRRGWSFANPGGRPELPDWGKIDRGDNLNRFYATAKVTVGDSLCLDREQSRYWSDRVYEATGRGGFLIMPHINALREPEQFNGGLPMYRWGDFAELEHVVDYWLGDPRSRTAVRVGCQAITAERHTYTHRMTQLLDTLGLNQGEQ